MLHEGIDVFLVLRQQQFILPQDSGEKVDMSDNIFLIGGDIKHHNFGEEPNEEVFEYAFHFYHFGGHLFVALLEEGEVVIKSCKEYLVRAVDGFTIVDLEDLGVGLVREGVLVGLQRVDCQRG